VVNDLLQRSSATIAQQGPVRQLSRSQKAAAVLLAVGPETAAKVLRHLSDSEVEQVALEIATLGQIAPEQMQSVLNEFVEEAVAHSHLINGGEQQAREVLRRLRGREGDEIVDRLLATVHVTPFAFLRQHEPNEVIVHLRDEHPQTIALILAHVPTKFSSQVLAGLEPELQAEVALRIAMMERTDPAVVAQVEEALQQRLGGTYHRDDRDERGGVRELAAMLNNSDRGTERAILAALEESDPELAEEVRSLMFVFEDIVTLDDRAIQEVLRTVDARQLAVALKGVKTDVHEAVVRNLSERAQQTLAEEIQMLGPVRTKDVEAAQTEIVRQVRRLEDEGTIIINRGDGDFIE